MSLEVERVPALPAENVAGSDFEAEAIVKFSSGRRRCRSSPTSTRRTARSTPSSAFASQEVKDAVHESPKKKELRRRRTDAKTGLLLEKETQVENERWRASQNWKAKEGGQKRLQSQNDAV